ncbi:MAG: hypothetical protein IIY06_02580 [Proteobacteria bacterium]|jgi:hypothetical protein|nr:hypothetical protein [Pseudomonadota bacterium]
MHLTIGELHRIIPVFNRQRRMEPIGFLFDERGAVTDVIDDEVKDNADAIFLRIFGECFEIVDRSEMFVYRIEIVSPVTMEGGISEEFFACRRKDWTEPNLSYAEFFEVGEFLTNTL